MSNILFLLIFTFLINSLQIIDFLMHNYSANADGFGINYCDTLLGETGMINSKPL